MIEQIEENQGAIKDGHPGYHAEDSSRFGDQFHQSYQALANAIMLQWPDTKNILELGCGVGNLAVFLRENRPTLQVITTDASPIAITGPYLKDNPNHFVVQTDKKFTLINKESGKQVLFDLIISYEHFEHLPNESFAIVIENIKRHAHSETILHATAANWPGGCHINIKPKDGWIDYLTNQGFKHLPDIQIINDQNRPYNFEIPRISELTFKIL